MVHQERCLASPCRVHGKHHSSVLLESLNGINPEFGFEVKTSDYPRVRAEALAGTDATAFAMKGVPTPSASNKTDFVYSRTWHALLDTYNEVVPHLNPTAFGDCDCFDGL